MYTENIFIGIYFLRSIFMDTRYKLLIWDLCIDFKYDRFLMTSKISIIPWY